MVITEADALIAELVAALKVAEGWIDPEEHRLVNREEARADLALIRAAIMKAEERS